MTSSTESLWFTDTLVKVHVAGEQTDGAYAVLECLAPSGSMPPPHVHEHDAESFLVLEGEVTVHTPAGPTVLRPGQAAHSPAGEPHTFCVTGTGTARIIVVSAPAGFLGYVRAVGRPAEREALPVLDGPPDPGPMLAFAAEHGITFLGPPGTVPADLVVEA